MKKEPSILVFDIRHPLYCLEQLHGVKLTNQEIDWLFAETLERVFLVTIHCHNRKLFPQLINLIKIIESPLFSGTPFDELRKKRENPIQMKRVGSSIYLREVHA